MNTKVSRARLLRMMRDSAGIVMLSAVSPALAEDKMPKTIPFAGAATGTLPAGFTVALTGDGGPAAWQIVADDGAQDNRALAQTSSDRTDNRFPICIFEDVAARDIEVSVRFKPIGGRVDRAGGIIVRVMDPNNYYVVRANALEDNVRLYRVVRGRRAQFAGADAKVQSGIWQSLGLRVQNQGFVVSFEGKELYAATDSTFPGPGRIGLWTKADSVTHFDRLSYTVLRA